MSVNRIKADLRKYASPGKAKALQRFFKTGPGEYGEGDVFLGVTVPQIRVCARAYHGIPFKELSLLLKSSVHEERLLALLILVSRFQDARAPRKEKVFRFYLKHTRFINNWDLVDLTAAHIAGAFLEDKHRQPLYTLACSKLLWERRIAIIATLYFIRHGQYDDTLKIARILLTDRHDLIQKAVGWMLREIGKRDVAVEEKFLRGYCGRMPRTMLRYAIERFPESKRRRYLNIGKRFP